MKGKILAFIVSAVIGAFFGAIAIVLSGGVEAASVAAVIIGCVAFVFGVLGIFSGQKWADCFISWLAHLLTS